MKKFAKMSLVAAVAVAGLSSTVSAQPLEEAIKGVDVSGMLRYRYDESKNDVTKAHSATNEYVFEVNTKSKVNDMVTANVSVVAQGVNLGSDYESAQATSDTTGDRDVNLVVEQANFAVAIGGATVIAGKQNIPGPFVDEVDVTRQGTGAVALIPVGPVTIAAGHFTNHDIHSSKVDLNNDKDTSDSYEDVGTLLDQANATELAIIGKVADINADVWYAKVSDVLSAYSIHANASIAGVNIDVRHSSLDMSDAYTSVGATAAVKGEDTSTVTKLVVSTKVGPVSVVAGVAKTGDDNGKFHNRIAIDKDNDAKTDLRLWQASVGQLSDATAFLVGAGMEVMPKLTLDAKYVTVDFGTGSEAASELLLGTTYAMTKNFGIHTRMSWYEVDNAAGAKTTDTTKGRLELKYTF